MRLDGAGLLGSQSASSIVRSGTMTAQVQMQAIEERDEGTLVAFRLRPIEGIAGLATTDPDWLRSMDEPFVAIVDAGCRLRQFGFAKETPPEVVNRLQALFRGLSLSLANSSHGSFWTSQEWDASGLYMAAYRRETSARSFTRSKISYVRAYGDSFGAAKGPSSIDITQSTMTVELDETGSWIASLRSREQLRVKRESGQPLADVSSTLSLERVSAPASPIVLASGHDGVIWRAMSDGPERVEARDPEPPQAVATESLEETLARLAGLAHAGASAQAVDTLTAYLEAHPEKATALEERLRRREIPLDLEPSVVHALERTNTPQAHSALLSMLSAQHAADNRVRSAAALPDISKPDRDTLNALRHTARGAVAENDRETANVRHAAMYGLGRLENRVRTANPELAEAARGELRAALSSARTPSEKAAVLAAMGNSGNRSFVDDLAPLLENKNGLVRSSAIQAMSHMPPDSNPGLFQAMMERESDPKIRAIVATTYADQARRAETLPSTDVLSAAIARLPLEPDQQVRAHLIDLIGPSCAKDDSAMQALGAQFSRETDPALLKRIGRYVPAERLGR